MFGCGSINDTAVCISVTVILLEFYVLISLIG